MVTDEATKPRKKKPRSPSYPGIPLDDAINRARVIYGEEDRNTVPYAAIMEDLGYSPRSGLGSVVIAALRKYGLLVYEGKNVRLSDLALRILWGEEGSADGRAAIQEAALNPSIHAELWTKYDGKLPSDAALKLELRRREFAESAIPDFITVLRSTLAFAGLSPPDTMAEREGSAPQPPPPGGTMPQVTVERPAASPNAPAPIQFPLKGGAVVVTLQASGPVNEGDWEQMMGVFAALKSGFISIDPPAPEPDSD